MINTTNWRYFYKICNGEYETTNLLYTPLVNESNDILCMHWDHLSSYQTNIRLTEELINFFFEREAKYIQEFSNYAWCPEIIDIDFLNKKIYIEWNKETLNTLIYTGQNLDELCPDWQDQIFSILKDINDKGFYKLALYPHCFFISKDGKIKTFDFYSCVEKSYPYIERSKLEGMIGSDSTNRFNDSTEGDVVNFKKFFDITMTSHLGKTWPTNPFPEFYKRLT